MLREYTTMPAKILAVKIEDLKGVAQSKEKDAKDCEYIYSTKGGAGSAVYSLPFTATSDIEEGDYIIQQSKDDIYHCPKEVFEKKYRPKAMQVI